MNFSISYDASLVDGSQSVADYLADWAMRYCDMSSTGDDGLYAGSSGYWAVHEDANSVMEYSIANSLNGSMAFAVDGEWVYDPESGMLSDYINTLHFGDGICMDSATGYSFSALEVVLNGVGDLLTDNYDVISCLFDGDVSALLQQLEDAGIDTSASLDCYPMTAEPEPYVEVVGLPDPQDTLLAA